MLKEFNIHIYINLDIQNTSWHVGKAEELLPKLFSEEFKRFVRRNLIGRI